MSTAKRSRQRQSEPGVAATFPPAKKAKTTQSPQAPASGLDFLTDERKRAGKSLKANLSNGAKDLARSQPDETKATISNHAATNNDVDMEDAIAGGDDAEASDDSEDGLVADGASDEEEDDTTVPPASALTNGDANHEEDSDEEEVVESAKTNGHKPSKTITDGTEDVDGASGPSFGDLLQAAHPETVDVQAAFTGRDNDMKALLPADQARNLQAPSATSLGTVLTQALRTNDKELLESCLQTKDAASIRSTIQRLQSPLVATLLQRLAERLHKRPGRAGPLMIWVQWSLVAHGGYLASQPQVTKKLKSLHQVVRERANSLQSLMTLKGKLDMLSAQIELRRGMQSQRAAQEDSDEDEEGVIYIEGEEDESSEEDEEDEEVDIIRSKARKPARKTKEIDVAAEESGDEDGDEDVAMVNGIDDADDESLDGEDDDQEGLIDDEAEETSDDEGEATSEEDDSADDLDDEDEDASESEEEKAPPAKRGKPIQRAGLARRK